MAIMIFSAAAAQAASLALLPQSGQVKVGQTFDVDVVVSSPDQGFNATQATIQFPANIVNVKYIDSSSNASVFNFWLEGPTFSNTTGMINFIGGTTTSTVGAVIKILRITFIATGSGDANIVISDSAVTAADGSGTNILSSVGSAKFKVGPGDLTIASSTQALPPSTTAPPAPVASPIITPVVVLPPTQIVRTAVIAQQTPSAPVITVPFYPDQSKWYNQIANFLAQWQLPSDITDVSSVLNSSYRFTPPSSSEGLFDSKAFHSVKDGLSYLHVKFKNNVGWGATADYRIAIDTDPPLPFTVESLQGLTTDNPQPTLVYKTSDALSGMAHYSIIINQGSEFITAMGSSTLPLLTPGIKTVLVRAIDNAGNVRENSIVLTIVPIASPVFKTFSQNVYTTEGDANVTGTAVPNGHVRLKLLNADGSVLRLIQVESDANGNWNGQFSGPFLKGNYSYEATAQDQRGALSLPVRSASFAVRVKPLLTLGGFAITQTWFFIIFIIIVLGTFGFGWLSNRLWRAQLMRRSIIAQRDVINVFNNVDTDLDKLIADNALRLHKDPLSAEIKFILNNIKRNLTKAKRYIIDNIKEISE